MPQIVPMQERFFKSGDYIGVRYYNGVVYFRVDLVDILDFDPYNVADENGTADTLAAQTGSTEPDITPKDPRSSNEELLGGDNLTPLVSGEEDRAQILHGSFGIFPSNIALYIKLPAKGAGVLAGEFPGIAVPSSTAGDHFAKVTGDESPYHEPTNFREIVITPLTQLSIAYFNDEPSGLTGQTYDAEQCVLHALFARYSLEILRPALDPTKTKFKDAFEREKAKRDNRLIKGLVSGKIGGPGSPVRFEILPAGTGLVPQKFQEDVGRAWGVKPLPDRVALLLPEDF